jgi:septation ring formation regulator EzrA
MNKLEIKKKLFDACLHHQNEVIENLKELMSDAQESANDYGMPKDRYDSYRMQLLRKRDMYGQQLEKALEEIVILKKIDISKENKDVSFGAVVITDAQKLFISISLGKIEIEGETFYAVSVKVPFYDVIKGKKKGNTFDFRAKQYKVVDVF